MAEVLTSILYPFKENHDVKVSPTMELCLLNDSLVRELTKKMEKEQAYLDTYMPGFVAKAVTSYYQQVENYKQQKRDHAVYALRANKELIGAIAIEPYELLAIETKSKTAFVTFFLFEAYQRQGHMLNALRALLSIYFNDDAVGRFEFHIHQQNYRSMQLITELGGQFECGLRNAYGNNQYNLYSFVLPDDLIKQNQKVSEIHELKVLQTFEGKILESLQNEALAKQNQSTEVLTLDELTRLLKQEHSIDSQAETIDLAALGDIADFDSSEFDYSSDEVADENMSDLVVDVAIFDEPEVGVNQDGKLTAQVSAKQDQNEAEVASATTISASDANASTEVDSQAQAESQAVLQSQAKDKV